MSKKGTKKTVTEKFPVSLDGDLYSFLMEEAKTRYGGNRSAAIADFIRDAKERDSQPFAPENALISDVKQVLRKLNLAYERDERGIDWIVPSLGLGLELKARLGQSAEQRMVAAMAYSVGRGRCTEILLVGGAGMEDADRARMSALASSFKLAKTTFISVGELPSVLGKILHDRSKKPHK